MINVTLSQLETFIAVAERQGFHAAARHLHLSQSAVSLRVSLLEQRLGLRLFERTTRSVSLTPEGERLLNTARHTLHDIEQLIFQLSDEGALNRGRFRMAALPSTAATIVPVALAGFHERHPNIQIHVIDTVADRAVSAVLTGDVEFALTTGVQQPPGLVFEQLFTDECLVVVPHDHPFAKDSSVDITRLADVPLLLPVVGSAFRAEIDIAFATAGLKPLAEREAINLATLMAYAEVGMGITFVPSMMSHRLDLSRCRALRLAPAPLMRDFGILKREGRPLAPAASAFATFLKTMMNSS